MDSSRFKIRDQIEIAYRNRSISLLYDVRDQAIKEKYFGLAEEAVRCIDRLINPFIFFR